MKFKIGCFFSVLSIFTNTVFAATQVDLVIKNGIIVTMDQERHVYENGSIAIRGSDIVYVGNDLNQKFDAKKTIDANGTIVIPGMINAHTHVPMTLLRGISDDVDLHTWLTQFIFPSEAKNVNKEFVYWGTKLACIEMIQTGTTTFADMYYFEDEIAKATQECGLRAILAETVIDFPVPDNNSIADNEERWENGITQTKQFISKWKDNPLITPAIGPHAPYTVSPDHLKQVAEVANELNVPVQIHLSETKNEMDMIKNHIKEGGASSSKYLDTIASSPVRYLNDLGFLSRHVIAAHVVWTSSNDLRCLYNSNTGVVHCPQSNLKLASGIMDVPGMLTMAIPVALGTDGPASNNDLILWEEMNLAAILHKGNTLNPTAVSAEKALEMATILGAKAIHMDDKVGSLEVGKKADVVIVDNRTSHQIPYSNSKNIYSEIVYAAKGTDVQTVVVNGKILMEDKILKTVAPSEIYTHAKQIRKKIEASLASESNPTKN